MKKNINQELCNLIRKAQGNRSQNDFAKQCGISSSAITQINSGTYSPKPKTLKKIAEKAYNGVTFEMLMYATGMYDISNISPTNIYDVDRLLVFEEIGSVRAGYDGMVDEIPTGKKVEIPASMISGDKKDYFVLRVKGNSMYPRLMDGDTILCKRCDSVDSGSLAVILYNGDEATVKKVNYKQGENWLELIPYNPEFPPKRIEGADLEQCKILGLVVKLIRDI